jgi:hypothetical protein
VSWEEYAAAARELARLRRAEKEWQRRRDREAAAQRKRATAQATADVTMPPVDKR